MQEGIKKTQLEKASAELVALQPNITRADRAILMKTYSRGLISIYTHGKGTDTDTALAMLTVLREQFADREALLNAETPAAV